MEDCGFPGLMNTLCRCIHGKKHQSKFGHECHLTHLKRKSWNTLFSQLKGPHSHDDTKVTSTHILTEVDEIYAYAYSLRQHRRFDEASMLEYLTEKFQSCETAADCKESFPAVLRLLLLLADSSDAKRTTLLGYDLVVPVPNITSLNTVKLPEGPLHYGDTKVDTVHRQYMHFPSELFQRHGLDEHPCEADMPLPLSEIFEAKPGAHLTFTELFQPNVPKGNAFNKSIYSSLYGALVQSTSNSIDLHLDLPDLADESYPPEIKLPKIFENLEDEGFDDGSTSPSSGVLTPDDSGIGLRSTSFQSFDGEIWQKALTFVPNKHRVWERIGRIPGPTELPYLTEAGSLALDHLWSVHMNNLCMIDPSIVVPARREINMEKLVTDVINALLGIPSTSFLLNEGMDDLTIYPGLCMSGLTPQGLATACQEALYCGSNYRRLHTFSRDTIMDSFYHRGLIFHAFTRAVDKYLQHYRACVLSIPKGKSLTEVNFSLNRVYQQIRFLAELCHCAPHTLEETEHFPTGVHLLSYLYQHALEVGGSQHYAMMLSLLTTSAGPYLMFVQDWVFHGICRDIYAEFLIQVNDDYLRFRDKHYWTQGFVMMEKATVTSVPLFLSDLANAIFICGKSINLLKLCAPEHFLFTVDQETPRVSITFSEEEISSTEETCQSYLNRMQQIAKMTTQTREQMLRRVERAKQELIIRARRAASLELEKLHEKTLMQMKALDARKRILFAELKTQMEEDLQRRGANRDKKLQEDKAWIEKFSKQEILESKVDNELEKQSREELIEYYSKLSEKAALREQKALWKIRRGQLDDSRIKFIIDEESKFEAEFEEFKIANPDYMNAVFDFENSDSLPAWAKRCLKKNLATVEVNETIQETSKKQHISDSSVGDVLRSEPVPRQKVEPIRHLGVQRAEKVHFHASQSTIQNLMYDEPQSKVMELNFKKSLEIGTVESDGKIMTEATPSQIVSTETSPDKQENDLTCKNNVESDNASLFKSNIRIVPEKHASAESNFETVQRSSLKISPTSSVSKESEFTSIKPVIKTIPGRGIGEESQEKAVKLHTKMSDKMNATSPSEQKVEKRHVKTVANKYANKESEQTQRGTSIGFNKKNYAGKESEGFVAKIKPRNIFGHASDVSTREYMIQLPKLKRVLKNHPSMESEFKCYQIRPHRRKQVENKEVSQVSHDKLQRVHIKMNALRHASVESTGEEDMDQIRLAKFKQTNIKGHSSDSTVQKLLYGQKSNDFVEDVEDWDQTEIVLTTNSQLEPYEDQFNFFTSAPAVDLMAGEGHAPYGGIGDYGISTNPDVDAHKFVSLPALLKRSIKAPLEAQIFLVNKSILNYFLVDLDLNGHLDTLRHFLLMEDGEFAQCLSETLFEKLAHNPQIQEVFNPMFLNTTLNSAMKGSMHRDDKYAANISFAMRYLPEILKTNAPNVLDCLELTYKVPFPMNVVITDNSLSKYGRVFSFMLQLKRVVWVLKDIWHKLKRDAHVNRSNTGSQFRQLQLFRHEMQYFVKVMQGYITNQIIHVTWLELQEDLNNNVRNLDDLHNCHGDYLNKCLSRGLLNKKAEPVMKIIQDIFGLILKLRLQLISQNWMKDPDSGLVVHPAFQQMCATYDTFNNCSRFLFKVVRKLAFRGYQPHLQELLLRLNYNNYYSSEAQSI